MRDQWDANWERRAKRAKAALVKAGEGARVEMTTAAKKDGIVNPRGATTGIIASLKCRAPYSVLIRPAGRKTANAYFVGFWRPAKRKK